jgi:hypothetical protein
MSKMGLYCPFGHLKHKLWPKERPGVKLVVWLMTTKSQESIRFPRVQAACDILLKSFRLGLQLYFRPHRSRRSARKIMRPKVTGILTVGISRLPLGSPGTNKKITIWMWSPWKGTKYTRRGKVVASPKSGSWWVLWIRGCLWLVLAPKVLQLCTNHPILVLCRFVWVIKACEFFLVPSQTSSTPFYPSKVLWAREHAPTL